MKIPYRKRTLRLHLILGLLWLIIFGGQFISGSSRWIAFISLLIAVFYFVYYFYLKKYGYLTLEEGKIQVGGPYGKRFRLNEVVKVRKFAGDYIVETDGKKFTLSSQQMDSDSIAELEERLQELNIEWN